MKKVLLYIGIIFNGLLMILHFYNHVVNSFAFPRYCSNDPCLVNECMREIKGMFLYNSYVFLSQTINVITAIIIIISLVYIVIYFAKEIKKNKTMISMILVVVCTICGILNVVWYGRGKCHQELNGNSCKIVCPDSIFMK